jgi:hypothetical protein
MSIGCISRAQWAVMVTLFLSDLALPRRRSFSPLAVAIREYMRSTSTRR